jgi:hypothetical protein
VTGDLGASRQGRLVRVSKVIFFIGGRDFAFFKRCCSTSVFLTVSDGTEIMEATAHFFTLLWWQKVKAILTFFLAHFCSLNSQH